MARVLFDSGSSFFFISESFAVEIGDRPVRLAFHLNVVTPLGEHSLVWRYLRSIGIKLGDRSFKASLIIMDMQEYDIILGMDWLTQQSAMIECAKKRVQLEGQGKGFYSIQGVRLGGAKAGDLCDKGLPLPSKRLCGVFGQCCCVFLIDFRGTGYSSCL